jgi:signal transduction histidine kinase
VRLRLTAVYVGLFVVSAAGLLVITDVLVVDHTKPPVLVSRQQGIGGSLGQIGIGDPVSGGTVPGGTVFGGPVSGGLASGGPVSGGPVFGSAVPGSPVSGGPAFGGPVFGGPVPGSSFAGGPACLTTGSATTPSPQQVSTKQLSQCATYFRAQIAAQRVGYINSTLIGSAIALAVMTVVAVGLGWVMSGRVLRPLRTIIWAARNISASNLHQRLALPGPHDELKELADTVDDLLARLEASFDAQRQFVANASHELRTPLARQRTLVEVALAEREPTLAGLSAACERVLAAGEQQERLIEALLTLARSQRGLDRRERIDLVAITEEVLRGRESDAADKNLAVSCTVADGAMALAGPTAVLLGDARLTERLVANLVDNAVRHNVPGGWISLRVGTEHGQAVLTAANSGPVVPPGEVSRLFAPFQRLGAARSSTPRTPAAVSPAVGSIGVGGTGASGTGGSDTDVAGTGASGTTLETEQRDGAERRDGHGLGLSIVSAIAAAHGADLQARARPDGGLHIELRFPPLPANLPYARVSAP